ncbi:MAG: hypothetical protein R2754_06940 [Microthrixaceae bacterium]
MMRGARRRRQVEQRREQGGFSTIAIAFVMLALTLPIVFIAEATLVAGRQATNNSLGQENLRAVDAAMSAVVGEIRLDESAVNVGCKGPASPSATFARPQARPTQGSVLNVEIQCSAHSVTATERVLDFVAVVDSGSGPLQRGKARVKYVDKLSASSSVEPGVEMLVCDWRLGEDTAALSNC